MRRAALVACAWVLAGCGNSGAPAPPQNVALGEGVAARVGRDAISVELVKQIARAQHVAPDVARERAISDALFANLARDRYAGSGRVPSAERSALARAVLEEIRSEAKRQGPPTDAEVEELTRLRWADLDRPPLARTRHVVIRVKDPSQRDEAREMADRLAEALHGIRDPAEFEKRAREFDTDGLEKRVETLQPVAEDGRVGIPGAPPGTPEQRYDPVFARAANALDKPGDQSPVVETSFGFHIIMLLDKLDANHPSLEERRSVLKGEILQRRAAALQARLLDGLQSKTRISIARAVESLVLEVRISQ